jgi:CTP-dependent riboflavin kinase
MASLHLTNGKAQIPSSWSSEIKSALGGIGMAVNGIVGEGFVEGELYLYSKEYITMARTLLKGS